MVRVHSLADLKIQSTPIKIINVCGYSHYTFIIVIINFHPESNGTGLILFTILLSFNPNHHFFHSEHGYTVLIPLMVTLDVI